MFARSMQQARREILLSGYINCECQAVIRAAAVEISVRIKVNRTLYDLLLLKLITRTMES